MTDAAYDINYLLELESASSTPTESRVVQTPPRPSRAPVKPSGEDILARELLQSAAIHEALVQQYLGTVGSN